MTNLLSLFADNVLPIFLAAGLGYWLQKQFHLDPRPVSRVSFFIFSPALLFKLLTTSQISPDELVQIAGFSVVHILAVGVLAWLVGWLLRLERRLLAAFILVAMFANAGNYGLSLNMFAFGDKALTYAGLYFVIMVILTYTVGILIVSLGHSGLKTALLGVFKVPPVYAAILGIIFAYYGWQLPLPLDRTVSILSDATLPVLMVFMGIQLGHAKLDGNLRALTSANLVRLVLSPLLGIGLSLAFGLQGAARQAGITEAAMPTAVVMTVLATEYNVEPGFVTTTVFISTILSPLTITPLLAYLGAT